MTDCDLFAGEWGDEDDELVSLLGEYISERHPALVEEDERFMTWLARDLRRRPPAARELAEGDRVREMRHRVLDRALGDRFAVPLGGREPPMRQVPVHSIVRVVDEAAHGQCAPWMELSAAAGEGRELWDEECDRWVELPSSLAPGRYLALGVAGDSMLPLLHAGDTILVRLGSEVQRDTIVVARRPDNGYVVKRVGRVQRRSIELLSLNPAYEPLLIPRDGREILGTVIMRWCAHDPEETAKPVRRGGVKTRALSS